MRVGGGDFYKPKPIWRLRHEEIFPSRIDPTFTNPLLVATVVRRRQGAMISCGAEVDLCPALWFSYFARATVGLSELYSFDSFALVAFPSQVLQVLILF